MSCKKLCGACLSLGVCKRARLRTLDDLDLANQNLIRRVRQVGHAEQVPAGQWTGHAYDLLWQTKLNFCHPCGRPSEIDLSLFEAPDDVIDSGGGGDHAERMRTYFRGLFEKPVANDAVVYVKKEAKPRFKIIGSILWAVYPERFSDIVRQNAANDNCPCMSCKAANDN